MAAHAEESPRTRLPRWVVPLLGAVALGLVPWTLWLTFSLPARHVTDDYDVAWVGFDVGLLAAFVATTLAAVRSSDILVPAASVTATLLVCDAWFDVVTASDGRHRVVAALEACFAELPLAALCVWIVVDVRRFHAAVRRMRDG